MRTIITRRLALVSLVLGAAASPSLSAADVAELLRSSGVEGGIVVHLGCGEATETAGLRVSDRYLVHGLEANPQKVAAARRRLLETGQYGEVSVAAFDGRRLPYVDNLVNLIVCEGATTVPKEEILRVLVPQGVALVGGQRIVKPRPDGIDEWTHFLHGSDNNAVARDRAVAAPRSIQWMAEPRWGRSHEEMASMSAAVTAGGRVFFIVDEAPLASIRYSGQWKLVGRDAFNGRLLWKRPIAVWSDHLRHFRAGPVHLPRRLVAAGDRVYATLGLDAPVAALQAATGETLCTYDGTERTEEILHADGVLYLVVGTSEVDRRGGGLFQRREPPPAGFRYLLAIDAQTGQRRWKNALGKDEFILPQTLAVAGPRAFCQTTAGVVCLDAATGEVQWRAARATPSKRMSFSSPTLVVADGVVLLADIDPAARGDDSTPARGAVAWAVHGWNEPGFDRKGKGVLRAYDAETGRELWSAPCSEGYNSPVDVFVVGRTAWIGADFAGYDLKTGESQGKLAWKGAPVGMAHHRCYRNKATEQYLLTGRSGVEVVSWQDGWQGNNSWLRGTCQYGVMPANGLIYAPPNACACFGKVKTPGFFAAAPQRGPQPGMQLPETPVREEGPAFDKVSDSAAPADDDWPMYRRDTARSGVATTRLPDALRRRWSTPIGGRLTQPVIAAGRAFVASTDAHTLYALDAADGQPLWHFTAGGRIDSAPSVYRGTVLFGSADGWVYCLRAADGAVVWRFRAAPSDSLIGAYDQIESIWPVHGAVLVQNDTVYATAGRSSYLDGGIVLYALDPATGRQRACHVVTHLDPQTGQQIGKEGREVGAFDMEGVYTDVLSGDGTTVFLKHLRFDRACQPLAEAKPHLFAVTGFLGEEWFVRSYWMLGDSVGAGWGQWANASGRVPFGRIMCVDGDRVYGYGRITIASGATGHRADAYHLYACDRAAAKAAEKADDEVPSPVGAPAKGAGRKKGAAAQPPARAASAWASPRWSDPQSLVVRAMVLAGERLVVAGPPDLGQKDSELLALTNEEEALAAFEGRKGVYLRVVSAEDGASTFETKLSAMPVFDGMAAAGGKLFIAMKSGQLECWDAPPPAAANARAARE